MAVKNIQCAKGDLSMFIHSHVGRHKLPTQLAEHCHFDILGDGCELAFCGLSMRGLLFSVPRSQEREFDCFWMHQIGLRSKQKERKQNTDKSSKFQRREQT